jgi:hypothetical protein
VQNLTPWVTWSSSNTGIATISNITGSQGLAATIAPGSTSIEAAYGGITGSATLTSSALTSIAVTPTSKSIPKGTTQQFTASGTLADSTLQNLTNWVVWSSSNTAIATIGMQGLASAIQVGFTGITGTFSLTTSNSATLTVTPATVVSIAVTPANQSIALGKNQQYTATGTFTDQTTQDITSLVAWSSSNAGIGTISNASASRGLFTSLLEGTTEITASLSGVTSAAVTMTVTPAELVSIAVTPITANLVIGNPVGKQFLATGIYTDGTTKDLTTLVEWVSSDTMVATISNAPGSQGIASSLNAGTTAITATLSGITSNQATLTVTFF